MHTRDCCADVYGQHMCWENEVDLVDELFAHQ